MCLICVSLLHTLRVEIIIIIIVNSNKPVSLVYISVDKYYRLFMVHCLHFVTAFV